MRSAVQDGLALDGRRAWVGGVCAGIARRLGTDPLWVRLAMVIGGLCFTAVTLALYAGAWLVLEQR